MLVYGLKYWNVKCLEAKNKLQREENLGMQQAFDYLEEAAALAGILENQPESVFETVTLFKSWTINDVLGHLHMFDVAALKTLESAKSFEIFFAPIRNGLADGMTLLETQYP